MLEGIVFKKLFHRTLVHIFIFERSDYSWEDEEITKGVFIKQKMEDG